MRKIKRKTKDKLKKRRGEGKSPNTLFVESCINSCIVSSVIFFFKKKVDGRYK